MEQHSSELRVLKDHWSKSTDGGRIAWANRQQKEQSCMLSTSQVVCCQQVWCCPWLLSAESQFVDSHGQGFVAFRLRDRSIWPVLNQASF